MVSFTLIVSLSLRFRIMDKVGNSVRVRVRVKELKVRDRVWSV